MKNNESPFFFFFYGKKYFDDLVPTPIIIWRAVANFVGLFCFFFLLIATMVYAIFKKVFLKIIGEEKFSR